MTTETGADLTFPPDPFHHGPCRVTSCTYGVDGGPAPAVFTGGMCARHSAEIGPLSVAAGLQERANRIAAAKAGLKDHQKARRKAAAKSRARNRR